MSQQNSFPEHYLYKIWSNGYLNGKNLTTEDGQSITVLAPGKRNSISGPDFQSAKILLGDKLFTGDIEFHVNPEEWYDHHHHTDKYYNQVILHVTFFPSDLKIETENKKTLPQLVLSNYLTIQDLLDHLLLSEKLDFKTGIPCQNQLPNISSNVKLSVLREFGHLHFMSKVNRFTERCNTLLKQPQYVLGKRYVWDQLMFEGLFRVLGYPNNKEAFEKLAMEFPVTEWDETKSTDEVLANLIKQSGIDDEKNTEWIKGGSYPVNHPKVRMAAGANLIKQFDKTGFLKPLLSSLEAFLNMQKPEEKIVKEMVNMLRPKEKSDIPFGVEKRESVIFNSWLPILYLYGKLAERNDIQRLVLSVCDDYENRQHIRKADTLLDFAGCERKSFTLIWGAIEIQDSMCALKRCQECRIGREILKS